MSCAQVIASCIAVMANLAYVPSIGPKVLYMYIRMYVYKDVCIRTLGPPSGLRYCICTYVCVYTRTYVPKILYMYVRMCIYKDVCTQGIVYVRTYVYIQGRMYPRYCICTYVCMYARTYVYVQGIDAAFVAFLLYVTLVHIQLTHMHIHERRTRTYMNDAHAHT